MNDDDWDNGMFSENLYYRTLWRRKEFAGIHFEDVCRKFGGIVRRIDGTRLSDKFDIVMLDYTTATIAIIETKSCVREDDVKKLVEEKVKNFKTIFSYYRDFKIYTGLGAEEFDDKAIEEARKYGIGLLQQVGETVEYAADWEVKAY